MTTFILPLAQWHPPRRGDDAVTCLTAVPGVAVAAGTAKGRVWVFAPSAGDLRPRLVLHPTAPAAVTAIACLAQDADVDAAGDERVLCVAHADGTLALWNVSDGMCLSTVPPLAALRPQSLAVSPCSRYLAVGGDGSRVSVHDALSLQLLAHSPDLGDWVIAVHVLACCDRKLYFAAATASAVAQLSYDEESRTVTALFSARLAGDDNDGPLAMCMSKTHMAFIGRRSVQLFDWAIGKIGRVASLAVPHGEGDWAGGIFAQEGAHLVLWTRVNTLYVYNVAGLAPISPASPVARIPSKLSTLAHTCLLDQCIISVAGQDFEVRSLPGNAAPSYTFSFTDFWPAADGNRASPEFVTCQALINSHLIRGTHTGWLERSSLAAAFTAAAPQIESRVQAHRGKVACMHVTATATSPVLITGGTDCVVRGWGLDDNSITCKYTLRHHATPLVALAQAGVNRVVSLSSDHAFGVLEPSKGTLIRWIPNAPSRPVGLAWRGDDHVLVQYPAEAHIWDARSGTLERVVAGDQVFEDVIPLAADPQLTPSTTVGVIGDGVFMVNIKRIVTDRDALLARAVLGVLLTRGIEPMLDTVVAGTDQDACNVTLGIRGAAGRLALMAPNKQQSPYAVSATVTATRLLALYLVVRTLFAKPASSSDSSQAAPSQPSSKTPSSSSPSPYLSDEVIQGIFARYVQNLPKAVGPGYCFSSLSLLSRYWMDSLPDLQQGSRILFVWTLQQMPEERKHAVVSYWHRHLPSVATASPVAGGMTKTMARATVILAVLGCETPELLAPSVAKDVALSLTLLMAEDDSVAAGRAVYRMGAMELLGRGFATWEPHINASAVVRSLIALGMTVTGPPSTAVTPATSPAKQALPQQQQQQQQQQGSPVAAMARQALLGIVKHNMALVVQTVVTELEYGSSPTSGSSANGTSTSSSGPSPSAPATLAGPSPPSSGTLGGGSGAPLQHLDKALVLRFVSYLVYKLAPSLVATGAVARITEAVVRVLDPTAGHRDTLIQPTTQTLFELVRRFPMVAFHAGQQRLAAGTPEGRVIVWDVKTASRAHVVEHGAAVLAVAFGSDGRMLITYGADRHVRVWQPPSGILYLLGPASNAGMKVSRAFVHMSNTQNPMSLRMLVQDKVLEISDDTGRAQYPLP